MESLVLAVLIATAAAGEWQGQAPYIQDADMILQSGERRLAVSMEDVILDFDGERIQWPASHTTTPNPAVQDGLLEVTLAPRPLKNGGQVEAIVSLETSPAENVLRKWVRFRVTGAPGPLSMNEAVLASIPLGTQIARTLPGDIQSYPVFLDGFFAGIEFPIAATRVENNTLIIAHRPGWPIRPDTWYQTRKAVFGTAGSGKEMASFKRYLMGHRPPPKGLHINYNSWWTSACPYYTETEILGLMQTFDEHMVQPYHAAFDTFCIDMGWSAPQSLWAIDPKLFPDGFTHLQEAAARMHTQLGLWISPSCCYPSAFDAAWAHGNGYESIGDKMCLGGPNYAKAFAERLVEYATRYGVRHFKLDGYVSTCSEAGHGHAPGPLSAEAIADGIIGAAEAVHQAAPGTWLEPTCFGWNPSPWWLFHFNSVIGSFGDDAPHGRIPSPVYRESYTTARDFFNLQGACWNPMPQAAQEVLGIIHQTGEAFLNDAVTTVLRGHQFLPVYLNPKYMDDARWKAFADLLSWAREQAPLLENTEPLLPPAWQQGQCPKFDSRAPMPRQPYGYRHPFDSGNPETCGELIVLRNPWIAPETYVLPLPDLPEGALFAATSEYPECRVYGQELKRGDMLNVPLMPYETLVLRITSGTPAPGLPPAVECIGGAVRIEAAKRTIEHRLYDDSTQAFGPDYTSLVGDASEGVHIQSSATVTVGHGQAELLILFDGAKQAPQATATVDNQPVAFECTDSERGWSASGLERPEHWCFLCAPVPEGRHDISMAIEGASHGVKTSAWVWAWRNGKPGDANGPKALPQPERISLDAKAIFTPADLAEAPGERLHTPRPIERIDGVFLDTLDPVEATQGWGTLQRNKSVWEKPMAIAGTPYRRGLGTHAPARIVYAINGAYKRFQAWAGADSATAPTITFEVWGDGTKRWESGLMKRDDPAKRIDIEVAGIQRLELVVGDGGNDIGADHADWADARLLR